MYASFLHVYQNRLAYLINNVFDEFWMIEHRSVMLEARQNIQENITYDMQTVQCMIISFSSILARCRFLPHFLLHSELGRCILTSLFSTWTARCIQVSIFLTSTKGVNRSSFHSLIDVVSKQWKVQDMAPFWGFWHDFSDKNVTRVSWDYQK